MLPGLIEAMEGTNGPWTHSIELIVMNEILVFVLAFLGIFFGV
jgi:hypothetical protein